MKVLFASLLALSFSVAGMAAQSNSKTTTATAETKVKENAPSQLDDLIRGEMAAVKTYNVVLEKVKNADEVKNLKAMKEDHEKAIATLKRYATSDVKEDTTSSGVWGGFTKAYTATASLFSDKTALKALNQGEEHGVNEYKEALEDENISAELKKEIRSTLLPRQEAHVKTFKKYL